MVRKIAFILFLALLIPGNLAEAWREMDLNPSRDATVILDYSGDDRVILEMQAPQYEVKTIESKTGTHQVLEMPGTEKMSVPGLPELPVLGAWIGIPPDSQVELNILSDDLVQPETNFDLQPFTRQGPPVDILDPGEQIPQQDSFSAPKGGLSPDSPVQVEEAWLRDQHVAQLRFYPLQFDASSNRVTWHKNLRVQVQFLLDRSGATTIRAVPADESPAFEEIYRSTLLNYAQARNWRAIQLTDPANISAPAGSYEATGSRYKIVVDQDGIYRITYEELKAANQNIGVVDPQKLHLSSQGYDVAIDVNTGQPGVFGPGDWITFYGERFRGDRLAQQYAAEGDRYMSYTRQMPDGTYATWSPKFNATMMEKYTQENVYWLEVGGVAGPRMSSVSGTPTGPTPPVPNTYTTTVRAEQQNYWYTFSFTSEDTFYWDRVQNTSTRMYPIDLSGLPTGQFSATVRGEMVARYTDALHSPDHHTQLWVNSTAQALDDATWDGISRYHFEQSIPGADLISGQNNLLFKVKLDAYPGQVKDDVYFDWYEISYPRLFQAVNDQITFERDEGGQAWRYEISGFTSPSAKVYNITDALNPIRVLSPTLSITGTLTFDSALSGQVKYIASGDSAVKSPKSITYYVPPDLKSSSHAVDYLIITHKDFLSTAQILANYRAAQGLSTLVVDVADLYNEFNYGIFHSIGIENFLAYTRAHWARSPTYVVLVGDGHWNFLGSTLAYLNPPMYIPPHLAWVDPWQGEVDSSNLLAAVSGNDILPDLLISRIPVNSVAELTTVINKIEAYESGTLQDWQRHLLFIADNADAAGDFGASADQIISTYSKPGYLVDRIYIADGCDGDCPYAITSTLSTTGALLTSYLGHGSITGWADENILSTASVSSLSNADQLTVLLSMTCLDGYWIHPGLKSGSVTTPQPSLVETLLRAGNGGVAGAFSPTGLGVATGHDSLQRGFFDALFNDGNWELGNASLEARLRLYDTGANRDLIETYTVFGDPAMQIQSPFATPGVLPVSDTGSGKPGLVVTYSIQVRNLSGVPDSYSMTVLPGNGWEVTVPPSLGPIPAGDDRFFQASVTIPADATLPGTLNNTQIQITSQGNRKIHPSITLTTKVEQTYGVSMTPASDSQHANLNGAAPYSLIVTNTGSEQDTLSISANGWDWPPDITFTSPTLQVGERRQATVIVHIPPFALLGSQDTVRIRVASSGNPEVWADTLLTTIVNKYDTFLPGLFR